MDINTINLCIAQLRKAQNIFKPTVYRTLMSTLMNKKSSVVVVRSNIGVMRQRAKDAIHYVDSINTIVY